MANIVRRASLGRYVMNAVIWPHDGPGPYRGTSHPLLTGRWPAQAHSSRKSAELYAQRKGPDGDNRTASRDGYCHRQPIPPK